MVLHFADNISAVTYICLLTIISEIPFAHRAPITEKTSMKI